MDLEPKENSDLLRKRNTLESNGNAHHGELPSPPDGGFRAIVIVIASFLTNGLLFGTMNSYSEIYLHFEKYHIQKNITDAGSGAALVGSLTMGTTFLLSPVSGVLTGLLGLRMTAVIGGIIATLGMILSSFVAYNIKALFFTFGIMYGLGSSFAYTPSLAILGHYYKKYLGIVNGLVTVGSSIFTVIMSSLMEFILDNYGLVWLFRLLAVFTFGITLCGLLFKPVAVTVIKKTPKEKKGFKDYLVHIINVDIWKNKKYMCWALSVPVALFGYLVPYVHIKTFVTDNFSPDVKQNLPLHCIAAASGVGRLFFGWIADKAHIDKILLQQIAFFAIGTLTIILPFLRNFGLLVAVSLGMGLFDGAFISLIGPIAFELCGGAHAAQAIGCMLGLAALPLSIGPPIASELYDYFGSYTVPFVCAGISPLVGATLMFAVRFHISNAAARSNAALTNGAAALPNNVHKERSPGLLLKNGEVNNQTAL